MNLAAPPGSRIGIDPDDVHAAYDARYADLTDEQVFDLTARVVSIPKREPANSFVLHAPLELLARRSLLRLVPPDRRNAVRERMLWVAATYERAGEPVEHPGGVAFASPAAARSALGDAIRRNDLDAVDAAASWLGRHATADEVLALADAVVDSLAAAGHGSIYFLHLARSAATSRPALSLLRPLAREIARNPELYIGWTRDWQPARVGALDADGARFADALAATPRLGLPGSDFVFPTVHQVDAGGQARAVIAAALPPELADARAACLRVAACSMLQDDPAFAAYGWSHCLTLPQGVLGITPWLSDPTTAAAIAATYVVAFRAAEGAHAVDPALRPAPTDVALDDALDADPQTAARATYHASDDELDAVVPELAARAGAHEDAHLAKYTLACFDAAATDPAERRLYLAAAAYLRAWWVQHG